MGPEIAESHALKALGWLVGNDELLPVFLGATGAGEADLRARAADPEFLASVVDFILLDDAWVIGCAASCGLRPEDFATMRAGLPGGADPAWT